MRDWDVDLKDAVVAAERAAQRSFPRRMLEMILSGEELPFNVSTEGMARFLDIAILIGDKESCSTI